MKLQLRETKYGIILLSHHAFEQEQKRLPRLPDLITDVYKRALFYRNVDDMLRENAALLEWIGMNVRCQLRDNPANSQKDRVFFVYDGGWQVYPHTPASRVGVVVVATDMQGKKSKWPFCAITVIARHTPYRG